MEEWRGKRFKTEYLPLVRPFSAVPDLLRRVRDGGLRIAVASSAKKDELEKYLDIAGIADLVDVTTCSDDVEESKPAPDIFESVFQYPLISLIKNGSRCVYPRTHPRWDSRRTAFGTASRVSASVPSLYSAVLICAWLLPFFVSHQHIADATGPSFRATRDFWRGRYDT